MTNRDEFNYTDDCKKIDASFVDAYAELKYDENEKTLNLNTSWGDTELTPAGLKSLVSDYETQTTLKLAPEDKPNALEYKGEDGEPQCIEGRDLARIIPMTRLADVSETLPTDGDAYVYEESTHTFVPYAVKQEIEGLHNDIKNLNIRIDNLENTVKGLTSSVEALTTRMDSTVERTNNHETRIEELEGKTTRPAGVPDNTTLAWGNINIYGDKDNTGSHESGIYTHNRTQDKNNDQYFA